MIKNADINDITIIEDILLDAVMWMKKSNLENMWNEINTKWDYLSKDYNIEDFYISYHNQIPVACMAITDIDKKYWPDTEKGECYYLHKLAVKRLFAGCGYSKELIEFAKKLVISNNFKSLMLDCNYNRTKLRKVYENEGFVVVGKKSIEGKCDMALYRWRRE